ncbi:MAG: two-component regulator propeller domain-containing protein [bacterium]
MIVLPLLAAIVIGVQAVESAPPRPIKQLVHTKWSIKDGAPVAIRDLAHTPDGYLWIGASSGLFRFDGARFVAFVPQRGDSLPSSGVLSLKTSRDGSLWIVFSNGIVGHFAGGRLTTYGKERGLAKTYEITESSRGIVMAGTVNGLSRFDAGKWKDVKAELQFPGSQSQALWFDREDVLWAQTENAVVYLPAGATRFVDAGAKLRDRPVGADFAESGDGTIWMAELGRGAHTLPRAGERKPASEVQVGTITLLIDRKGSLWVGSAGDGLRRVLDAQRLNGRTVAQFGPEAEQYTAKDGLASDVVYALHEDGEGNIWVASTGGLDCFREGDFVPIPIAGSARPRSIFAMRDSSLWIATHNVPGLLRLHPRFPDVVVSINGDTPSRVTQDSSGHLLFSSTRGLFRPRGRSFVAIPIRHDGALNLWDLVVDDSGTAWVFDLTLGLARLAHDSLVLVVPVNAPTDRGYLRLDSQRRLWTVQQNEVSYLDHGALRRFLVADGKAPRNANSVFEDLAGNIWLTSTAGLSKFEGDRFRTIPKRRGVPGQAVTGAAPDANGAWWMLTKAGVVRLEAGEADRALTDSTHSLKYRTFDQLDGFPGSFIPYGGQHVVRTADGLIWVATDSGVASLDPRHLSARRSYTGFIEGVRIDGRELVMSEAVVIPALGRDLEIDYTATNLSRADRMRFRYRLEGHDPAWIDAGVRRRAYYNGLAPGTYSFRVSASSGDDIWNDTGAPLSFRVLPSWYQTLWFRGFVIMLIGGAGAGIAAIVQRRRHMRHQETLRAQYEATLAERSRIAQDLHDTLLQGFAGVALQVKAAEMALPERPDIAAETLMRVQRLTRDSLREARESVWDMRETELGSEDLPAALETCIRERTAGTRVEVSVESSGERRRLSPQVEHAAYRIGREAMSNAVRHAEATRIEVHVMFEPSVLRLEVRDNGRGFAPEQAEVARHNGHFGLSGMGDRATAAGGHCELRANPDRGTIVAVELPLVARAGAGAKTQG